MSQHKRNVQGMQNAIREKSELATLRVKSVIHELLSNNQIISFNNIANQAQVSKGWLYQQSDLCTEIKRLRLQHKNAERPVSQASLATRDAVIDNLKNRLKKLESDNQELRKQLEIVYGELHLKNSRDNHGVN